MKSEVKKKMMFNEHATHTPKSLQRSSSRNFFAGNRLMVLISELFSPKQKEDRFTSTSAASLFEKQNRARE